MKQIILSKGKITLVDDIDYEVLKKVKWHYCNGYASRKVNKKREYMHHFITGVSPSYLKVVDHVNQNKLDNRRKNLRLVSRSVNATNSKMNKRNKSNIKGVDYYSWGTKNTWRARYAGKHLGFFATAEEAENAYITRINNVIII